MYKYLVYKVTNIENDKIYFGITSSTLAKRRSGHYRKIKYTDSHNHFHNALRKYPVDSFRWEILVQCFDYEFCKELEIKFIKEGITQNPKIGYNTTSGGDGVVGIEAWNKGIPFSEEVRQKMSAARKGKTPWNKGLPILPHVKEALLKAKPTITHNTPHSEETKKLIGQVVSQRIKENGCGFNKGKKWTAEQRANHPRSRLGIPPSNKGVPMTAEQIEINRKGQQKYSKAIIAVDLNSGMPRYFSSIKYASEILGLQRSSIAKNVSGKTKQYRNFVFTLDKTTEQS